MHKFKYVTLTFIMEFQLPLNFSYLTYIVIKFKSYCYLLNEITILFQEFHDRKGLHMFVAKI